MVIFPSSYVGRAPKISFYFIFSNSSAVLPLLVLLLPPVHPAHPSDMASCPGFTTALCRCAIQGKRRAVKCLEREHLSGERLWLAWVEEGTPRPICICFYSISTPCTLTLSGKSLLDSLLGAQRGKRLGWNGRFQPHRVCLSMAEASASSLLLPAW